MQPLQKRLDGTYEAAHSNTTAELLSLAPENLKPCERVRIAWMLSPHVQAFIKNATLIALEDEMTEAYRLHLVKMQAFESFARNARNKVTEAASGQLREYASVPNWYPNYLRSQHWIRTKTNAQSYYGSCVLCGSLDKLECHHRHYRTIGAENIRDLSILCSDHHSGVQSWLGICVPRQCPTAVLEILSYESLT